MKKVGFFRSIRVKFVVIYVLLILFATQVIGVYFVRELETKLVTNFKNSLKERVNLLEYNLREEMLKDRNENSATLEKDIRKILGDFAASDVSEVRVIDNHNRIIGTSDPNNQGIVGQRTTELAVKRTLAVGSEEDKIYLDQQTHNRIWVYTSPIVSNKEVIGAVYLVAKIENVFKQMNEINQIFISGTIIALLITAFLGILIANTITKPITEMRRQALAMGKGNFSRKVKVYGNDEIGQLAITFNNMTKRLQEAQASTESERRKLSSVLSYMTDGVIATDRRGRVILINKPATEMLNVSRETVMSESIVTLLHLEGQYEFEDLLNMKDSINLDFSTKDRPYILRANFSILQKETGFLNGLIVVLHDITEQEEIEMERKEFVANVSHELRTPLTTMRSYLEALADGAWKDPEIAPRFLEVAQNETERMIRLVNDLLQLSKMDNTDFKLEKEELDFVKFFHRIIDRFEMTKEQHVVFERKLPNYPLYVEFDPDKLTQVLDNIISNALKYSPEGGQITFKAEEKNHYIEVSIKDQGMGIPKKNLDKIFERFYRVDKARSRKMGGTGLGLAIAKQLITAHGGKIWATSVEGKGTTIYLTLPYEPSEEEDWS
ncbi:MULTISPECIES: cell wall metabolism sensor histidine kinase WalK [Bacillus]|jgi:two-component system sensor histidine kinase VicK|uniref:cell wall metabolism sensor histidine kinase WalK n=1 Tax=Bacillus TaxID=1386 RepID=UPI00065E2E9A|nr:cell wall metabolism sensor histidine kinase WalK [Bacillus smithii]AKP48979.1 Two-component sensor kinase SA14-24 [Bacillus smithii]MED1420682.1 cell wall metabolism sensor histidine kinase WalK [Bacillus smithii]MED1456718.1 cell wall metabolism sensor histidine kinase WalK [Bacillus smithii]MED4884550.1 cell wall metabolism sensor histidine kinase WalK [Bacillus smithii]MED4927531.1 cell wall metabolism sensor histidine kinase WalK [Bacillus smithii]